MVQKSSFTGDEGENYDIREDKSDRAFSTHGEKRNSRMIFVNMPEMDRLQGRPRRR
jgi:hypothetical protein